MQAARLFGIHDMRLADVAIPTPGAGEVLIKIEAAGICGTDRHLFNGEFPCAPPVTLGHEFSGIVVAVGGGVALPEGTRIACDPNIACGVCDACRRGRVNLCASNVAIGIHRDGGFGQYAVLPAHRAHILPVDLNPLHGAFCEPLACTLHGMDMGAVIPGERVIILGGGVIGLLAVQLARAAGATVMLVTRQAAKRDLALSLGADITATDVGHAKQIWPQGADLVVECAGVHETIAAAPRLARAGGRVVVMGVLPQGQMVAFEPFDLLFREIQLHHAFLNPFTQSRAVAMIAGGFIRIDPLISRVIGMQDAQDAIANPPRPGEVKVLIVP